MRDDAEVAACCNPMDGVGRCLGAPVGPRCVKMGGCCYSKDAICPQHH